MSRRTEKEATRKCPRWLVTLDPYFPRGDWDSPAQPPIRKAPGAVRVLVIVGGSVLLWWILFRLALAAFGTISAAANGESDAADGSAAHVSLSIDPEIVCASLSDGFSNAISRIAAASPEATDGFARGRIDGRIA